MLTNVVGGTKVIDFLLHDIEKMISFLHLLSTYPF